MSKLKQLRTRCFFDVSIAEDIIGRVIFELYNDVCPKTCENFKALCTGEKGNGKVTGKPLHYKNVLFHRVVKTFIIQSGDFSLGNGRGGESIYGGTFEDESFDIKHTEPFMLSMANRGKNTNGSQFFITLAPAPHLDGVHVVFGHVISGQEVILKIANQAVDKDSKPFVDIRIANCGELIPQIKPKDNNKKKSKKVSDSGSSSSDSSSDDSSSGSDSESGSSSDDGDSRRKKKIGGDEDAKENESTAKNGRLAVPISDLPNAPKIYNNIKADEIPEVPQNRFLARTFKPKEENNKNGDTTGKEVESRDRDRDRERERNRGRSLRISYTKSGRKVKGRGSLRFRTPSPDRGRDRDRGRFRRSETPPHWKAAQSRVKPLKEVISKPTEQKKNGDEVPRSSRASFDDRSRERHRRSRSRSGSRERHDSSKRSGSRERRNSSRRSGSRERRNNSRRHSRSPKPNDSQKWTRKRSRSRSSSREPEKEGVSDRRKERKSEICIVPEKQEHEKREVNPHKRSLEVRDTIEE